MPGTCRASPPGEFAALPRAVFFCKKLLDLFWNTRDIVIVLITSRRYYMPKDPRVPFTASLHASAVDKIEKHVDRVVRAENIKRGAIIERMLLESIKKEEA